MKKYDHISNFMNICKDSGKYLTEESLVDEAGHNHIDLNLFGDDALLKTSQAGNARNFKFLIQHGVKLNYIENFKDHSELLDIMKSMTLINIRNIMQESTFENLKSLVKVWKDKIHDDTWTHLTSGMIARYLIVSKFEYADFIIKEFGVLPKCNDLRFFNCHYDVETCKKLILDYCLKDKIANLNIDTIISGLLGVSPKFIECVFDMIDESLITVTRNTLMTHFTLAHIKVYKKTNEYQRTMSLRNMDAKSLSSDIIDIYLKRGFTKSDVKIENVSTEIMDMSFSYDDRRSEIYADEARRNSNTENKTYKAYDHVELSSFNESLKKILKK